MITFLFNLRNRHFFVLDLLTLAIIPTIALALRLDGLEGFSRYANGLLVFTALGLLVWTGVFLKFNLGHRYWRYASVDEITLIVASVATATAANALLFLLLRVLSPLSLQFPRSGPIISGLLMLISIGGSRLSIRVAEHVRSSGDLSGEPVLIIGAGDAGRMIAKELRSNPQLELDPVGFVDDDPTKQGMKIHGLHVLGSRDDVPQLVQSHRVKQAIIAMPTAPGKTIRQLVEICEETGVTAKTIPGVYELLSGQVSINQIRSVEIEDLLRREPLQIEIDQVARLIRGKRVLVTGAGGSIGSELCRQIAQCAPSDLILLGHGETSIFKITRELWSMEDGEWKGENGKWKGENGKWKMEDGKGKRERTKRKGEDGERPSSAGHSPSSNFHSPPSIVPVIADIRDRLRLQTIFQKYQPHIVFHAAAHKHVPLMECNAAEAVTNNVLGTQCLIEAAEEAGVECFVLISTDKAVNPTSIMGVTKRVAEKLIVAAHHRQLAPLSNLQLSTFQPSTRFTAVRFGNVLGSRGSVVNIFREQIARGGPVTVTHPDMRRYFMTIPEAVQLVLQAAAIGHGGELFVLDMGEPVPIVQLAHDLIKLSGLEVGRDVDVIFTGRRPGEKLFEELFLEDETYHRTRHDKIFVCQNGHPDSQPVRQTQDVTEPTTSFETQVDDLIAAAERNDTEELRRLLKELVPEYQPV